MADDGIPARLAALDTAWEWISDAPARVDTITSTLSAIASHLEAISDDDVNKKVLDLVETSEKALPDLTDKLSESQKALEENTSDFEKTSSDLEKRIEAVKSQVGV